MRPRSLLMKFRGSERGPLVRDNIAFDQRRHTMTNPERIKQILLSEIDKMNQHREDFCRRPGIFCTLKHAIAAVNFHSKSRQMITHEIWARLILFNFCSYITGQVAFKEQKRRHVHQVDFSIAFKTCRHFLRLHSGEAPPDVEGLIRRHTLPVRPSKNFARQQRFQVPVSFTYRF